MEFRSLGGSGLNVPVLGFGTATFGGGGDFFKAWGDTDVAQASRLVDLCLDGGLKLFDTANIYSGAVRGDPGPGGRRPAGALLATKATFRWATAQRGRFVARHLIRACEASLRRLNTDHVDIYTMHGFDARTPVEETLPALDAGAQRQGALHRLLQLLGLAPHEVAVHLGSLRLVALRGAPGLLLAGRSE